MIGASERIIARKIPIKSCGDESARCSGSSRLDPRSVFSTSFPPFTTPSTINDTSFLGPHFGSSEPKQPPAGKMRLPSRETGFDLANSLHPARYRDNALLSGRDIEEGSDRQCVFWIDSAGIRFGLLSWSITA
jgi:hypothetical protein